MGGLGKQGAVNVSDVPLDDLLPEPAATPESDPTRAYDGGWERAIEEGDGFEDHLLGEKPSTPEL